MGSALSYALVRVLREDTPSATWPAEFSRVFIEQTRITRRPIDVMSPDALVDEVRSGRKALLELLEPLGAVAASSWVYQIAGGLEETALPILSRQQPLTADSATALRLTVLCLAAEADALAKDELGDTFRAIAAGVTLLERRANNQAPATETIILATVRKIERLNSSESLNN
jgi:hypothetical protein